MAVVFVIPIGIIKAMTGIEVTLNVLAEFIGGMWVEGNALAMNFFKSFGYVCNNILINILMANTSTDTSHALTPSTSPTT